MGKWEGIIPATHTLTLLILNFPQYGQLGHCTQENRWMPTLVENLKRENIIQVTCEALFTAALTGMCANNIILVIILFMIK
jgi:hypothetical protein